MCLLATTQMPLIAQEDIKVYKLVIIKNNVYYTPFQRCKLTERPKSSETVAKVNSVYNCVEKQAVHAYTNKKAAIRMGQNGFYMFNWAVIEGIIPKGTLYWDSIIDDYEIAAKYIDFGLEEYKES